MKNFLVKHLTKFYQKCGKNHTESTLKFDLFFEDFFHIFIYNLWGIFKVIFVKYFQKIISIWP